jgi:hypothetical protein
MDAKNLKLALQQEEEKYLLSHAAWNIARVLLWPEQKIAKEEEEGARQFINYYFEFATDRRTAFVAFCERVVLTQKYVAASPIRYVPSPSLWLNPYYQYGFAGTKKWFRDVQAKRLEVPGYMKHVSIMAHYYMCYALRPSHRTFHKCRKKLLKLRAFTLLQSFYHIISHLNHSN